MTESLARRNRSTFIFKKGDYYYLFVSWGCAAAVRQYLQNHGWTVKRRKRTLFGQGWQEHGPKAVAAWCLPATTSVRCGSNSAYTFDGKGYLVFHAYEAADNGLQKLKIAEIKWDAMQWR